MAQIPDTCPACSAAKMTHRPETGEELEWAEYACEAQIIRFSEDGSLDVNEPCMASKSKLDAVLREINAADAYEIPCVFCGGPSGKDSMMDDNGEVACRPCGEAEFAAQRDEADTRLNLD